MNPVMFSIVLLTLLAHSSISKIVVETEGPEDNQLYRAAVDIAMTCYGDPGDAIGIIGDRDGSILKALRLNHFIPVVLVDGLGLERPYESTAASHKLQVFVIAIYSGVYLSDLLNEVQQSIWYDNEANFLIVDTRTESEIHLWMHADTITTFIMGILNVQFISRVRAREGIRIIIWNINPFINRAPKVWTFVHVFDAEPSLCVGHRFLYGRVYREGGQSCESINFVKTNNLGGYPLHFITYMHLNHFLHYNNFSQFYDDAHVSKKIEKLTVDRHRWLIDNIAIALNVSVVVAHRQKLTVSGIYLHPSFLSSQPDYNAAILTHMIILQEQKPIYAITQHTGHMSQLEKILSVVDKTSRIGMYVVYLITFLFFKFFLGQAVIPALLNLVRLTCSMGLPTLPQNFAPKLYLTSLLMFVVTMQAIYTGNLSTLLTTTIPYPNLQTRKDITRLSYKIYIHKNMLTKLMSDPLLHGHEVIIPVNKGCLEYVMRDPLGACAVDDHLAITLAEVCNLHVSRNPIGVEYLYLTTTGPNFLKSKIQSVMTTLFEAGIHRTSPAFENFRLQFVDDEAVKKNTVRRVMTFEDLRFAFVILGIGLLCSTICFIGEIVIFRIRLKYVKRRDRVRVPSAWGATTKKCPSFRSLNCRFNLRRLFSNRR